MSRRTIVVLDNDQIDDIASHEASFVSILLEKMRTRRTGPIVNGAEVVASCTYDTPRLFYYDGGVLRDIDELDLGEFSKVLKVLNQEAASKVT